MTELFSTDESLSPRLEWMRRYSIQVRKGLTVAWIAYSLLDMPNNSFGEGATEDEAITALAKLMGWKLWNEGGYKL